MFLNFYSFLFFVGKLLLIRENFFDDLIYYDKKNVPDDIYYALSQICSVSTFRPEHVKPGSLAAASFCSWILAIYEFSKFERTYGAKIKELKKQEDIYNKRLVVLGEKRIKSENICQDLESNCNNRLKVLKKMKMAIIEKEKLKEHEIKAKELLKLIENDNKTWTDHYNRSKSNIETFKIDALLTAAFISYAGVFDSELRNKLVHSWFQVVKKIDKIEENTLLMSGLKSDLSLTNFTK